MKRYEKFVLEAEKGITFKVLEGTRGELIIRARNITISTANVYSANNVSPPVLEEYKHVCGEWNDGFVYGKIVLEAGRGITFEVSKRTSGEIIIRARNITISTVNVYSTNYVNPIIPEGYKHVCGEWNNGFVIERSSDGSQFVWIPVGSLDSNGTLDGEHFTEKFGRRNYRNDEFSDHEYHETLNGELFEQIESVKKYGGFYISRYNISRSSAGKPQSVKGVMPWNKSYIYDAMKMASSIEDNEAVKSHLTFGAEYDSVLEWFIETKVKTFAEIAENSTGWGNYCNTENSPKKVVETGSREEWCANNIYDFAGNLSEWTQEEKGNYRCIIRGGNCRYNGDGYPVATREITNYHLGYRKMGFRATLCIK